LALERVLNDQTTHVQVYLLFFCVDLKSRVE